MRGKRSGAGISRASRATGVGRCIAGRVRDSMDIDLLGGQHCRALILSYYDSYRLARWLALERGAKGSFLTAGLRRARRHCMV